MNFCSECGSSQVNLKVPENDDRPRYICSDCKFVFYRNPKVVAGCILEWQSKILFCRRAIEPRSGFWTVPAGFMENEESVPEAAAREAREEAGARCGKLFLHSVYSLKHVNQVYMMYRGGLKDGRAEVGRESQEVRMFDEESVPWDQIAFPVITQSLKLFFRDRQNHNFRLHQGDILRDGNGELQVVAYD